MACDVVWRVVSLPATESRTKKAPISACVRRSPSISACTSPVMRSSPGCRSRKAASSVANSVSVHSAAPSFSSGDWSPAISGSETVTSVSAACTTRSRSASGTPIMSEIVCSGRRLAISSTKSPPPVGAASSTMRRALARMPSSMRLTCRGVKAAETRPRSFVWRGASMARNDCDASSISGGASPNCVPLPEQNSSGLRETWRMSS